MKKNLFAFILVAFVVGTFFSCSGNKEANALLNKLENEIKDAEKMKKDLLKLVAKLDKKDKKDITSKETEEVTSLYNDHKKKARVISDLLAAYQLNSMIKETGFFQDRRYNKLMDRAGEATTF